MAVTRGGWTILRRSTSSQHGGNPTNAVLAIERAPRSNVVSLCRELDVILYWLPAYDEVLDHELHEARQIDPSLGRIPNGTSVRYG